MAKRTDENEDENQIPLRESPTGIPARVVGTSELAPEATLDASKQAAEATLAARTRSADAMRKARKRPLAKAGTVRTPATSYTVEAAANLLSLDPTALRARLRRAQRREGTVVVADLGGGISGFKLGKSWRLRFPER
jgi:hypothetical protein